MLAEQLQAWRSAAHKVTEAWTEQELFINELKDRIRERHGVVQDLRAQLDAANQARDDLTKLVNQGAAAIERATELLASLEPDWPKRIFPDGRYWFTRAGDTVPVALEALELDDHFVINYEGGEGRGPFVVVDAGNEGQRHPYVDYVEAK